jgi:hypothetical protein
MTGDVLFLRLCRDGVVQFSKIQDTLQWTIVSKHHNPVHNSNDCL